MIDFRIMPAQGPIGKSGMRYGFRIPNHPYGAAMPIEPLALKAGDYVASWATKEIAEMAAYSLGFNTSIVEPVRVLVPDAKGDWS